MKRENKALKKKIKDLFGDDMACIYFKSDDVGWVRDFFDTTSNHARDAIQKKLSEISLRKRLP